MHEALPISKVKLLVFPSNCLEGFRAGGLGAHHVDVVLLFQLRDLLLQGYDTVQRDGDHENRNQPIDHDHEVSVVFAVTQVVPVDVVGVARLRYVRVFLEDMLLF